jgi:hypothetical protein
MGRLTKLHGQCLLERAVEHGIAGRVYEIGEEDKVFIRESIRLRGVPVKRGS